MIMEKVKKHLATCSETKYPPAFATSFQLSNSQLVLPTLYKNLVITLRNVMLNKISLLLFAVFEPFAWPEW